MRKPLTIRVEDNDMHAIEEIALASVFKTAAFNLSVIPPVNDF